VGLHGHLRRIVCSGACLVFTLFIFRNAVPHHLENETTRGRRLDGGDWHVTHVAKWASRRPNLTILMEHSRNCSIFGFWMVYQQDIELSAEAKSPDFFVMTIVKGTE
jgi:hypothetical protein